MNELTEGEALRLLREQDPGTFIIFVRDQDPSIDDVCIYIKTPTGSWREHEEKHLWEIRDHTDHVMALWVTMEPNSGWAFH